MICLSASEIDGLIAEDLPYGDLTTHTLGIASRLGRVHFAARGAMVVCCTEEAKLIFERLGASATVLAPTGMPVPNGGALIDAPPRDVQVRFSAESKSVLATAPSK